MTCNTTTLKLKSPKLKPLSNFDLWDLCRVQKKKSSKKTIRISLGRFVSTGMIIAICFLSSATAKAEIGLASWYSTETCKINKHPDCPTASGRSLYALEKKKTKFAASWNYPLGTKVLVCRNSGHRRCTVSTIVDRGPGKRLKSRVIDLSLSNFREIGNPKEGLIPVSVTVLQ